IVSGWPGIRKYIQVYTKLIGMACLIITKIVICLPIGTTTKNKYLITGTDIHSHRKYLVYCMKHLEIPFHIITRDCVCIILNMINKVKFVRNKKLRDYTVKAFNIMPCLLLTILW